MNSRNNPYATDDLTDFSSVFMNTSSAEQLSSLQMFDEDSVSPAIDNAMHGQALTENKNLSSIISHIRDEGSAKLQPKKVARRQRPVTQKKPAMPVRKTPPRQQQFAQPASVKNEKVEKTAYQHNVENLQEPGKGQWLPLVLSLALAVTAVMGYNLYQLAEQTSEMKVVLTSYEEQIDELSNTQEQSSKALTKVSNINEDLTDLKQEMHAIKADYAKFDSKLSQSNVTTNEPQQKAIAMVEQNVSELENSLESTRSEMTAIKVAMEKVEGTLTVKHEQPVQVEATKPKGWVVNLASLSTKAQAQIGVAMLEKKSGIIPGVQEVEVNGATIYRLIVKGFSSRDEAMLFIGAAKKQYGFDGGWAWQA